MDLRYHRDKWMSISRICPQFFLLQNFTSFLWDRGDVPCETQEAHEANRHVGGIEFPPAMAIVGGSLICVMIVVPALAKVKRATHQRFLLSSRCRRFYSPRYA